MDTTTAAATFDPFADEAADLTLAPAAHAQQAPMTEEDWLAHAEMLNTLALNAGAWQGDCREWQ